ncbi:PE domain-containing protein [Actinokineospora inagensis]|uniref:PE domain-containing protein n=1 Tax=Actinokineospora inagensis TaxID=103730 RepID=UPI0003FC75E9|nr:PE domain-containing protein [Actinokineospora inagensis]
MTDDTQVVAGAIAAVAATARMAAEAIHQSTRTTTGQFVINRDNVLAAAKVIQVQADTLQKRLDDAARDLQVVPPGNDDVSRHIATEWNDRLIFQDGSYSIRVNDYITGLRDLVNQLRTSAKTYGYNEDEIKAALGSASG